jgi:hypothetical protein
MNFHRVFFQQLDQTVGYKIVSSSSSPQFSEIWCVLKVVALSIIAVLTCGFQTATPAAADLSDPVVLMRYCAELSLPCGLQIKASDFERSLPKMIRTTTAFVSQPLANIVSSFNVHERSYRSTLVDEVFVIRPTAQTTDYLLEGPGSKTIHGKSLMGVTTQLFTTLLPLQGGVASIISPAVSIDMGDSIELTIQTGDRSYLSLLNEIAKRTLGHPWLITTADDDSGRILSFGFVHKGGFLTQVYVSQTK